MSKLKFNYDKKNDILYINIGVSRPSYGSESEEGIIIRRDFISDKIRGITILDFMKRYVSNDEKLDNLPLPVKLKNYDMKSILHIS